MSGQLLEFEERDLSRADGAGADEAAGAVQAKPKWRLQKLTKRHKDIAALLISGEPHALIAELCHCRKEYIPMLKQQPLFRDYMKSLQAELEDEFSGLFKGAVRALKEGVSDRQPMKTRLEAGKLILESQGRLKGAPTGAESAEDVAQRLVQQFNIQVNVGS